MNAPLTQSLLQFMLWFAVASIVGIASYWIYRLKSKAAIFLAIVLSCYTIPMLGKNIVAAIMISDALVPYYYMGLVFLFGIAQATIELKIKVTEDGFEKELFLSLLTQVSAFYVGMRLYQAVNIYADHLGVVSSLVLTPLSISIFRWMYHTSKLRPGVDRHFREGEETQDEDRIS